MLGSLVSLQVGKTNRGVEPSFGDFPCTGLPLLSTQEFDDLAKTIGGADVSV